MRLEEKLPTENPGEFRDKRELDSFIRMFEESTLPRSSWNHCAHLAVAMWYLSRLPEAEASQSVVDGIRSYNRAQGIRTTATSGYHETITFFWLGIARRFLVADRHEDLVERVNAFLSDWHDRKDYVFQYYSRDLLESVRARTSWVEPDLRPMAESPE